VTDHGLREAGHVATALAALDDASVTTAVYDGISANPTTREVDEGLAVAREHAVDCIVGLGGGSSLDCAKGINFLLTNGGRMEDYWGSGKAAQPMLPSVGVPTTAGTGSEAQSYALISQEATGVKMACGDKKAIFRAVVLDPTLAATVPREVAAMSGIDAVSHAVESYVSLRANPISRLYATEAWRRLEDTLGCVLTTPDDLDAWGRMQLGALLAGASIEQSMLGAAHACANPLTARFDVPHGIAVGLMLPHVVRFNASHVGERYEALRSAADGAPATGLLDERIEELRRMAGLPESLRDYSIPRECFPELAADAEQQWTAGFNPRPVGRQELLDLYEAAY
jgi:alcohol dehydrogenase